MRQELFDLTSDFEKTLRDDDDDDDLQTDEQQSSNSTNAGRQMHALSDIISPPNPTVRLFFLTRFVSQNYLLKINTETTKNIDEKIHQSTQIIKTTNCKTCATYKTKTSKSTSNVKLIYNKQNFLFLIFFFFVK